MLNAVACCVTHFVSRDFHLGIAVPMPLASLLLYYIVMSTSKKWTFKQYSVSTYCILWNNFGCCPLIFGD